MRNLNSYSFRGTILSAILTLINFLPAKASAQNPNEHQTTSGGSALVALATQKFGTLTPAETKLFTKVGEGEWADYSTGSEERDRVENSGKWGPGQRLKADRIKWLCTANDIKKLVSDPGIRIKGAFIEGELDLSYTVIEFPLEFIKCVLPDSITLMRAMIKNLCLARSHTGEIFAQGMQVSQDVFMNQGFTSKGEINFVVARIAGNLICDSAQLICDSGYAFLGDGMQLGGSLLMRFGSVVKGQIRLPAAKIGGTLECDGSIFESDSGFAIYADRINVAGSMFFRNGFIAKGGVRLLGAVVGSNLECDGGQFLHKGDSALCCDGMMVMGSVFLRRGFRAEGIVRLIGSIIGGDLDCEGATFLNKHRIALDATQMKVTGGVNLCNRFSANGLINFDNVTIEKQFTLLKIDSASTYALSLGSASIGSILDDSASWPSKGDLFLDGLIYGKFHTDAPTDPMTRLVWLRRQPDHQYFPQPYEQLAAVYRKEGRAEDAISVLIQKNEDPLYLKELGWLERIGRFISKWTICYGYKPFWVLYWFIGFAILGPIIFKIGFRKGLISPASKPGHQRDSEGDDIAKSDDYPHFNAFFYSLDVFLPIIDLHQEKYWLPNVAHGSVLFSYRGLGMKITWGTLLRCWMWFQILMGWGLTSILIAGLTGLIRS